MNGALAEALRQHRGLRIHEKKALVSIVLSHLARGGRIDKLNIPRAWLKRKGAGLVSKDNKPEINSPSSLQAEDRVPIIPFKDKTETSEVPF